jgi:plastocyanin
MPDWLIEIVPVTPANDGDPTAAFEPATQDVLAGDNITWSNRTDEAHQPVPLNPSTPAWDVDSCPAGESSNPTYSVRAPVDGSGKPVYGPVTYQCQNHPDEIGTLNILQVPPTF